MAVLIPPRSTMSTGRRCQERGVSPLIKGMARSMRKNAVDEEIPMLSGAEGIQKNPSLRKT